MKSTEETRARAENVFDYIAKYPEQHNQNYWFGLSDEPGCGTTMCVAGTTLFLEYGGQRAAVDAVRGQQHGIIGHAAELLGLNAGEAHAIFYDMDNENAVQLLKKVVVGEEFADEDYDRPDIDGLGA